MGRSGETVLDGVAALVLAGGRSSRMGRPKTSLPFGDEPMLTRVVRRLATVVRPVVVVAAPGQVLPELPSSTRVARDAVVGRGPLQGIAAGLAALGPACTAVFVTTTDAPFLHPAFVRRLWALRASAEGAPFEAVVPRIAGHDQPLCALYATSLRGVVAALLAEDLRRASLLAERARSLFADEALLLDDPALREADGALRSLRSVNTLAEYEAALVDAKNAPA